MSRLPDGWTVQGIEQRVQELVMQVSAYSRFVRCNALIRVALPLMVLLPGVADAQREYAEVPKADADLSEHIIDCDVFGWNKNFTELGVLASDVKRDRDGRQRGQIFVVIYPLAETVPIHNIHTLFVSQAEQRHDPMPIADIRSKMWAIGYGFENMWPRRPTRKHYPGAMKIEPLTDMKEISDDTCQPTVGFRLGYRGEVRYQPHRTVPLTAPCDRLKHSETRTYWGRRDIGAVMLKFEHSPTPRNEHSTRLPVSAAWSLAKPIKFRLRSPWPTGNPRTQAARGRLKRYGSVEIAHEPKMAIGTTEIRIRPQLRFLGKRVAKTLNGVAMEGGVANGFDIVVRLGIPQAEAPAGGSAATPTVAGDGSNAADRSGSKGEESGRQGPQGDGGTYIDDFEIAPQPRTAPH